MPTEPIHQPILVDQILAHLPEGAALRCIDATLNGGGHSAAILDHCGDHVMILGIDRDPDIVARARERFAEMSRSAITIVHANFRNLTLVAKDEGFDKVDFILLDLGVSSYHYDLSQRGFRFAANETLDMRFDPSEEIDTATDLLNELSRDELSDIFKELGEERFAYRIARGVERAREEKPISSTEQLLAIIESVLPRNVRWRANRSAARIFQSLR